MVSVNYSSSSSAALASIRNIEKLLGQSQKRMATGLKIASASDNATLWSAAVKLRQEDSVQDTINSGMTSVQSQAEGTLAVLDAAADIFTKIKVNIALGYNTSASAADINAETVSLQSQITNLFSSANFGGENWITTAVSKAVTTGISGSATNSFTFAQADFDAVTAVATGLATITTVVGAGSTVTADIATVDAALREVTKYAGKLKGLSDAIDTQKSIASKVSDIRKQAISELVDADMEEEAARITALQVQQQLAYQALSITSQSSQNILRLFQ